MIAVFSHEIRNYFHTLTAYVFGAFLLIFTGIGSMMYNISAAVSNFEYVLGFCSIVFVLIVPLLTMRVIAEERKQKTDQLLYSLPVSTTEIVTGKYLALLVVYTIPFLIISLYPLVFSRFGDVYFLTSYGSIIAFFLMGTALIAVGVFISSLTENQGFAAGISVAVILLNYFCVTLSEYVSRTALSSLIAICILILILAMVMDNLTKNHIVSYGTGFVLFAALMIFFIIRKESLEDLLPNIMNTFSLFNQFNSFINGVFDIRSIVYYLSVMGFFLFLTVQSLEKRRYN